MQTKPSFPTSSVLVEGVEEKRKRRRDCCKTLHCACWWSGRQFQLSNSPMFCALWMLTSTSERTLFLFEVRFHHRRNSSNQTEWVPFRCCCCFVFKYLIDPCGKFGSRYLGKAQQPQEQRYPFLSACVRACVRACVCVCVCSISVGFLTCAQMMMHAIAHGGCMESVRESALQVWEKKPLPHWELEPASVFRLACQSAAVPNKLSPPLEWLGTQNARHFRSRPWWCKRQAKVSRRGLMLKEDLFSQNGSVYFK